MSAASASLKYERYADGEYYVSTAGYRVWVLRGDAAFVRATPGWYWRVYDDDGFDVASGGDRYTTFKDAKCGAEAAVIKLLSVDLPSS